MFLGGGSLIRVASRPVVHEDIGVPSAFHATPVLFTCADSDTAHECALMLRHGGLVGPVGAAGGVVAYQIAKFSTNTFTYY